jgi:hypothetical protein
LSENPDSTPEQPFSQDDIDALLSGGLGGEEASADGAPSEEGASRGRLRQAAGVGISIRRRSMPHWRRQRVLAVSWIRQPSTRHWPGAGGPSGELDQAAIDAALAAGGAEAGGLKMRCPFLSPIRTPTTAW